MNSPPPFSSPPPSDAEPLPLDPVFLQSRRELAVIVLLFLGFFAWSVGTCYAWGYMPAESAGEAVSMTWGMPTWFVWGILFPWLAVDVAALWFCFFYMKDDDLGEAHETEDVVRQVQQEAMRRLEQQHGTSKGEPQ
jgi:hypothetical protein